MIGSVNVPGVSSYELEQGLEKKENLLKTAAVKETPADQDSLPLVDGADGSKTKRVLWSKIKAALKTCFDALYAGSTHASQHASTGRDPLTAADIGAAPADHQHTKGEITDFPTSMPASDVHEWAKADTKPSYTASEVGAATLEEVNAAINSAIGTAIGGSY